MYISNELIRELELINWKQFDLTKIIDCCNRANQCFDSKDYWWVLVSVREICDSCPPIFNCWNFTEVCNSFPLPRSDKKIIMRLDQIARSLADKELHWHIKAFEVRPDIVIANFSQETTVLLSNIIEQISAPKQYTKEKTDQKKEKDNTKVAVAELNKRLDSINPLILENISKENPNISANITDRNMNRYYELLNKYEIIHFILELESNWNFMTNNSNRIGNSINDLSMGSLHWFNLYFKDKFFG